MTDSPLRSEDSIPLQAQPLIKAGLGSQGLLPTDTDYEPWVDSYWCNSAKLRPACIFQPRSAPDVAKAVVALAQARQLFAIRGGGHMNWPGSNNITDGVTIDLALLNATTYDSDTKLAHVGPGAKWKDVYAELDNHGRVVVGAREAEVGVGGFLLGGGNTYYTPRYGFACDNIDAYEVVLTDGRIVTAEAGGDTADLFRVLKGGGNNFGIITRFILRTVPSAPVWGGMALRPVDVIPAAAKAFVNFTAKSADDVDSSLMFVAAYAPRFGGGVALTICTNMVGKERPPALREALDMPEVMNNFKTTSLQEVITYTALPTHYYNIWFTLTFRNDVSIILKASELHTELAKELAEKIPDGDFTSHVAFQSLPRLFVEQSLKSNPSGNVLGLEQNAHDGIFIQASASVRTVELEKWARPKVQAMVEAIRDFASPIEGGLFPFVYLNYAHPSQEVLRSYGPENVRRMKEAAAKYDPAGVLQRLCPGGFKISALNESE